LWIIPIKNLPLRLSTYICNTLVKKEMYTKWSNIFLFLFLVFFVAKNTQGQTTISHVINKYQKVISLNACNSPSVTVASTTDFSDNDRVLIIQMKGASVTNTGSGFGTLTPAGSVGNAGNYEFNEVLTTTSTVIYLKYALYKTYDPVGLQIIKVPQYGDVTIVDTLTADPWNGSTGGVLTFESSGIVTFNGDINVEGLGFRGGDRSVASTVNTCSFGAATYYAALATAGYGGKGEGVSEYLAGKERAQNCQANGGGGGHSSNTGAGGGGNYGKGGIGGYQSKPSTGSGGCTAFGTGPRGQGGISVATNYVGKVFMGGGGGGGQQNNYAAPGPPDWIGATGGNPGGGIVIINALAIDGNGHHIYAAGFNGRSLNTAALIGYKNGSKRSWGDSGGGGGAGGAVLLSASNYASALNVDVSGGRGDTVFTEIRTDLGPGGGGGGGVLWLSGASRDPNIIADTLGGPAGWSWNWQAGFSCNCVFGAADGDKGRVLYNLSLPLNNTPCVPTPVSFLGITGKENNGRVFLNWSTALEINNDRFVLEKSGDGVNFEYLSSIKGQGNSDHVNLYSYVDKSPFKGANYYRLKQYDYDGSEYIQGYLEVLVSGTGTIIERIYPNPCATEFIIESSVLFDKQFLGIKIMNVFGTEINSVDYQFEKQTIIFDASTLSKGVYFLQITYGGNTEVRKIIKE
jgi:hypothetical protein